jgi:hypothetical protein
MATESDWRTAELLTIPEAAEALGWDKQRVLAWVKRPRGPRRLVGGEITPAPARNRWRVTSASVHDLAAQSPELLGLGATLRTVEASFAEEGPAGQPEAASRDADPHRRRVMELEERLHTVELERDQLRNRAANLEETSMHLNRGLLSAHLEAGERLRAQADALAVWLVRDNPIR